MIPPEIDVLMRLLSRLPGLGPRSARRVALHLMARRDSMMLPLAEALATAGHAVQACPRCGNLDTRNPCGVCRDTTRDSEILCVVEDVGDLWALERTGSFKGRYHVLGGTLSALDGIAPEDLRIESLLGRLQTEGVREVVLALNATVDGQTTAHYLADRMAGRDVRITRIAHGVPMGGDLDHLDDGTLMAALKARREL
jgi:recombination protein RecR